MLGRLRRKFVLIIMVLLGLVLGTALAVQTASIVRQYREETARAVPSRTAALPETRSCTPSFPPFMP